MLASDIDLHNFASRQSCSIVYDLIQFHAASLLLKLVEHPRHTSVSFVRQELNEVTTMTKSIPERWHSIPD